MERIALAERFFDKVEAGIKTSTIRYKHRDYKTGIGEFYSDCTDRTKQIAITDVVYKKFGEMTERDAIQDGFETLEELRSELLSFYPTAQDEDEVTKVVFVT